MKKIQAAVSICAISLMIIACDKEEKLPIAQTSSISPDSQLSENDLKSLEFELAQVNRKYKGSDGLKISLRAKYLALADAGGALGGASAAYQFTAGIPHPAISFGVPAFAGLWCGLGASWAAAGGAIVTSNPPTPIPSTPIPSLDSLGYYHNQLIGEFIENYGVAGEQIKTDAVFGDGPAVTTALKEDVKADIISRNIYIYDEQAREDAMSNLEKQIVLIDNTYANADTKEEIKAGFIAVSSCSPVVTKVCFEIMDVVIANNFTPDQLDQYLEQVENVTDRYLLLKKDRIGFYSFTVVLRGSYRLWSIN